MIRKLATRASYVSVCRSMLRGMMSRFASRVTQRYARKQRTQLIQEAKADEIRKVYSNAWCIMDRPDKADDNSEHLYRYLLHFRKDINAFFILNKTSDDWKRLEAEGFRLLEPNSKQLSLAVLNSDFIVSSDAVYECMYPVHRSLVQRGKSRFVFLQHGVIMNDLSRWLNPKDIHLMITSTVDEFIAISGVDSPYRIAPNRVALTGLARFDALLNLKNEQPSESENILLIMPTWRHNLQGLIAACNTELDRQRTFQDSNFYRSWSSLLSNDNLEQDVKSHAIRAIFVPHPSLRPYLQYFDLPSFIELADSSDASIQDYIARSKLILTDYSSVSFDAAYLRIPSVYYQFDKAEIFGGSHNFREGYFEYESHAFGPVLSSQSEVLNEVLSELNEPSIFERYEARFSRAFPTPDTSNRYRIVRAIESSFCEPDDLA
ncbi:CDP-glycerol glycerophosphotransferase family protein [Glutamicibacter arilaitensis]|uniref:CDP-glycerol glycerophosphotransferase family protein n=1 Tax=Glutamicibacter arilaitensis TaxID=256701 RepID=UPI003FD56908